MSTLPEELLTLTAAELIRNMIREQARTVAVYIDGIEYRLSLKRWPD